MRNGEFGREATTRRFAFSLRGLFLALTFAAVLLGVGAWFSRISVARWSGRFTVYITAESATHRAVKGVGYVPIWGHITDEQYLERYQDTEPMSRMFRPCETRSGDFLASMPSGGSQDMFGRDRSFFRADRCLLRIEYADGEHHLQIVKVPIRRRGDVRVRVQIP